MGMGMSGWEWEGMGKFKKNGMGLGREWEGMGTEILLLHTSTSQYFFQIFKFKICLTINKF